MDKNSSILKSSHYHSSALAIYLWVCFPEILLIWCKKKNKNCSFNKQMERCSKSLIIQFSSVQSLSRVRLLATPWIAARQASLSITNSRSLFRLMCIELVMPSSHLILCHPLLLLPPIPPSIRVFSNESTLRMRWPKYWSFAFSIIPSKEIPGLISFRMDWLDLLAVQGTLKSLLQHHSSKASLGRCKSKPHWDPPIWVPCCCCLVAKSCLTLVTLSGSSVHGISQARILEWVAISFSRGYSWPRDQTLVSCIGRQILYHWATREAHLGAYCQ